MRRGSNAPSVPGEVVVVVVCRGAPTSSQPPADIAAGVGVVAVQGEQYRPGMAAWRHVAQQQHRRCAVAYSTTVSTTTTASPPPWSPPAAGGGQARPGHGTARQGKAGNSTRLAMGFAGSSSKGLWWWW